MTHLSPTQMSLLLERAKFVDKTGRLHLMVLLGWRHGLRAIEICTLKVRNFDMRGGCLTVQRVKGSNRTTQDLFPDELVALPAILAGKGRNDWVFPGRPFKTRPRGHLTTWAFWDNFKQAGLAVEFPGHVCHPHVLKHTTGMTVIEKGIENCRQYLGHKSIASTGAYLRVSDAEASKAAMAAFGD